MFIFTNGASKTLERTPAPTQVTTLPPTNHHPPTTPAHYKYTLLTADTQLFSDNQRVNICEQSRFVTKSWHQKPNLWPSTQFMATKLNHRKI